MLIFFVAYQMTLDKKSFWYPYLEIAADSDLPIHWGVGDIAFIEEEAVLSATYEEANTSTSQIVTQP